MATAVRDRTPSDAVRAPDRNRAISTIGGEGAVVAWTGPESVCCTSIFAASLFIAELLLNGKRRGAAVWLGKEKKTSTGVTESAGWMFGSEAFDKQIT